MIAALCACLAVRFYVVQTDRAQHRWTLDVPVHALTLMFIRANNLTSALNRVDGDPDNCRTIAKGYNNGS